MAQMCLDVPAGQTWRQRADLCLFFCPKEIVKTELQTCLKPREAAAKRKVFCTMVRINVLTKEAFVL